MPDEISQLTVSPNGEALVPESLAKAISDMELEKSRNETIRDLEVRKSELHEHLKKSLAVLMQQRRATYENRWNRWRRNARSIYDPEKRSLKQDWQSAMFVPLSMMHKEIIKGSLYRTLVAGLPINIDHRPSGSKEQADMIRELTLREMERGKLEIKANDVFEDVCTYGTGVLKHAYVEETQPRTVRMPKYEDLTPDVQARAQAGIPQRVIGYIRQPQERIVYRGIRYWWVSIWDVFFPQQATDIKKTQVFQRFSMSYQDVLDGVRRGWYFPEAELKLKNVVEGELPPEDKQQEASDLLLSSISPKRVNNDKQHTAYEFWGLLPKKWVYLRQDEQDLVDDPDQLVPAKGLFTTEALLDCAENEKYDGSNPFEAATFIHQGGSIYGIGPMEMLEQIQDDINETSNQRKDNVQLILNRMFAILESAIVSKADLVSRPGGGIRLKGQDVRQAFAWLDAPDVTRSSYEETLHDERFAQEVLGSTRVTIGSGGAESKDITDTYGGLELLRTISNERLGYYAMLVEAEFLSQVIRGSYIDIYDSVNPDDVVKVLGEERASKFQLLTPEEVDNDYRLSPQGVFASVFRPQKKAAWRAFREMFKGNIWFNDIEIAKVIGQADEVPNLEKIIVPVKDPQSGQEVPFDVIQQMAMQGPPQLPGPPGRPAPRQ